jgi:hypothetical protein
MHALPRLEKAEGGGANVSKQLNYSTPAATISRVTSHVMSTRMSQEATIFNLRVLIYCPSYIDYAEVAF